MAHKQEERTGDTYVGRPKEEVDHDHDGEYRSVDVTDGDTHTTVAPAPVEHIRGGFSFGSIFTGMAVALGAMFLLTALIGGIAVATGLADDVQVTTVEMGWGIGIGLVIAQFIAYLWGGYAAGRMARGAGILNGLLVPVLALLLVGLVAGAVAAFGADARFAAPFTALRFPVEQDLVVQFGLGLGIASIVAMFIGGMLGGAMGARWHDKLEATADATYPRRTA